MYKNLVIVESPSKLKTIKKYLDNNYIIKSCNGHVRDLVKGSKAINIKKNFKIYYEINREKKYIINELKKISKKFRYIYLASDNDREGEAISWHLKELLEIKYNKIKRIIFREITKNAIQNAIQNPKKINFNLINAQQTRRILDRIVGYKLSYLLWKKIKIGLSAGRVQSVAVRLVVEKERSIHFFNFFSNFKVKANFINNNNRIKCEFSRKLFKKEVEGLFLKCKNLKFLITKIKKKVLYKSSLPPFKTSTLQQEANKIFGYSVTKTMFLAQNLYESGAISYIRTDSIKLSKYSLKKIKEEIIKSYGVYYFKLKIYKNISLNIQEAHEAIRPTNFSKKKLGNTLDEKKLYKLIWSRSIASQMKDMKMQNIKIIISANFLNNFFFINNETTKFEGFLKAYKDFNKDNNLKLDKIFFLKLKDGLSLIDIEAVEIFNKPPSRYTEASFVKKLEELGIGRPSTYAPIISTIQKRGYINKKLNKKNQKAISVLKLKNNKIYNHTLFKIINNNKNKLFPTNISLIVNDFLVSHFSNITNYKFTANIEKKLDSIAQNKKFWIKVVKKFYEKFYKKLKIVSKINKLNIIKSKFLGKFFNKKLIITRFGKYGPFIQFGENKKNIKFISLRKDQLIEYITLNEALDLFKFPRDLGAFKKKKILIDIGRYGPYIKYNNEFYKIPKIIEPILISKINCIKIIKNKKRINLHKTINFFFKKKNIRLFNGPWSSFFKLKTKSIFISQNKKNKKIKLKECIRIIFINQ